MVWPIVQGYAYLDLTPIPIEIKLQGALSQQNIRVNTPATFTVGISTEPASCRTPRSGCARLRSSFVSAPRTLTSAKRMPPGRGCREVRACAWAGARCRRCPKRLRCRRRRPTNPTPIYPRGLLVIASVVGRDGFGQVVGVVVGAGGVGVTVRV